MKHFNFQFFERFNALSKHLMKTYYILEVVVFSKIIISNSFSFLTNGKCKKLCYKKLCLSLYANQIISKKEWTKCQTLKLRFEFALMKRFELLFLAGFFVLRTCFVIFVQITALFHFFDPS
jgi:hypothetical protein